MSELISKKNNASKIGIKLDELESIISKLDGNICQLLVKIEPIIGQPKPSSGKEANNKESNCELANKIQVNIDRLISYNEKLIDVLERIEL